MDGELFIDTLNGESSDYVPLFIRDMTIGMDILNVKTTDVFTKEFDAEMSAKCITAFSEMTGQDACIGVTHSAAFIIEQFGGKMRYPEKGIPIPVEHPFENTTDFSNVDTNPNGKMVSAIESYSRVRKMLPNSAIVGNVTGPFTKAGVLCGMETLAMHINSNKDVLDDMIDVCLKNTESVIEKLDCNGSIDAGIIASATDNPDLFGKDAFTLISIPWTKKIVDMFHKKGYPVIYHPHGDFTSDSTLLKSTLDIEYDGFHYPENNDLETIKNTLGSKKCILGGTDIVPTIYNGIKSEIENDVKHHMDVFKGCNYVFMASCSMQRGVPLKNVRMLCDAYRDHRAL